MFLKYSDTSNIVPIRSVYRHSAKYGQSFHWLEAGWGNRETVVLLHGFMAHSIAYRKIVPRLSERYRLVMVDLPGHGRDQTFRAPQLQPRIAELVTWLEALLETLVGEDGEEHAPAISGRVHLVGHSLSALAAFLWAQQPGALERVKSLTLVGPGVRLGVPGWAHHAVTRMPLGLAKLGATSFGMRCYEPIQWRKSRMTSAEIASYVQPFRQEERLEFMVELGADLLSSPDRLDGAEQVRPRTLILWGDRDHLIRRKSIHALQSGIGSAQLEVLHGIGHCPMEDAPEDFNRLLHNFFTR